MHADFFLQPALDWAWYLVLIALLFSDADGNPLPAGGAVQVTVSIPATKAVPDLLAFLGVNLSADELVGHTVMRKD